MQPAATAFLRSSTHADSLGWLLQPTKDHYHAWIRTIIRSERPNVSFMSSWASCIGLGMALNSAMRVCARVQIPVCPEPHLVLAHELLGGLRTGFLVGSPLRIACVFLHVERGRSSKRVWRSPRIIYLSVYLYWGSGGFHRKVRAHSASSVLRHKPSVSQVKLSQCQQMRIHARMHAHEHMLWRVAASTCKGVSL
jgi:hypothetical protein